MRIKEARNLIQEGFLGIRLVGKLASTLKKTIEPDQARAIIRQRLEQREDDFIEIAKKCIYAQPQSPYWQQPARRHPRPGGHTRPLCSLRSLSAPRSWHGPADKAGDASDPPAAGARSAGG